jgi:hypothetical protein
VSDAFRYPWDGEPPSVAPPLETDAPARAKPRGRRTAPVIRAAAAGTAPDWLFHHLTISGPRAEVEGFAAAARGSGITPWQLDFADIEETVFTLAVSQPASRRRLTVEGCRILARQFRERVEQRQARAMALLGANLACPFDLHVLLPVAPAILQLGPTHPAALAWMTAHWGITGRLRQVSVRAKATTGRRLPVGHTVIGYSFFTDRETPDAAIRAIGAAWPALRFRLALRTLD